MNQESENRICQNCKKNFTIEPDDFRFYEKIKVPPPTFCPLCRAERRAVFRNERVLFKVENAFTGKDIFSLYPKEGENKSITEKEWFGDNFDATEYACDYDFSRSFFEQFFEFKKKVPVFSLRVEFMVDSPYSANATALKNSYLCFNSNNSENCMYSNAIDFSKDCLDDSHVSHSERCYESFWLQNCYQCYFTIMSVESRNLWFCRDCLGCNDCLGCINLRKSSYCIFNKQYTKEEYRKEIEKILFDMMIQFETGKKGTLYSVIEVFRNQSTNKIYEHPQKVIENFENNSQIVNILNSAMNNVDKENTIKKLLLSSSGINVASLKKILHDIQWHRDIVGNATSHHSMNDLYKKEFKQAIKDIKKLKLFIENT